MTRTMYQAFVLTPTPATTDGNAVAFEVNPVPVSRTRGGTLETDLAAVAGTVTAPTPGAAITSGTVTPNPATGLAEWYGADGYQGSYWVQDPVTLAWTEVTPVGMPDLIAPAPTWTTLSQSSDFPAFVAAGGTQQAARDAIGAGTSSLAIGTTSTTAKAGNYAPSPDDISGVVTAIKNFLKAADAPTALDLLGGLATTDFPITTSSLTAGDVPTWDDQAQVWSNQPVPQVVLPSYLIQGVILNPGQPVPSDFPDGAIAFVRATAPTLGMVPLGSNGSQTTTATVTVNITDAVAVGENVHVEIGCTPPTSGTTSAITVTDAGGNTYTNRGAIARGTVIQGQVFSTRATTALASGAAVTATLPVAVGDVEVEVSKMSGLASPSFDQSGQASGGGVTALNVTTNATTQANELATLVVAWNNGTIVDPSSWTDGTGWTQVGLTRTSGGSFPKNVATFVKTLTTIGAVSVTPQITLSGTMVALLATFKAA